MNLVMEPRQFSVKAGLHEGRREMSNHFRVTAPFGDDGLAYVVYGIKIKMRHSTDKNVRPVTAGKRRLLGWSEFQAPVCSEMHERVRFKTVFCPEVGSNIIMRRGLICAVNDFSRICPGTGERLRHEHDVSETQARHRDRILSVFFKAHIIAGGFAVLFFGFRIKFRRYRLRGPFQVFLHRDKLRFRF